MVVALAETVEEAPASQADTIPIDSIALPDAEGLDQPRIEQHTERDEAKGTGSPHRIILRQGLPSKELLETILFHLRGGDAHQRAVAFYLVDFDKREEYKLHACPTTAHFAQARLGLPLREAQELLRVGRKLEILEELDEAFARGVIGWCKLREISRIATPETEWAWLLYAKSHNMREIERAVRRKKEGDPPPKAGEGEGGALQTFLNVTYRLTAKAKLAWETAYAKVSSEFPKGASNDEIFMYMAELLLRTSRDPEREGKHPPIYTIVFQMGPDGRGWAEFNEGRMEIPARDIYEIAGKARVIEVPPLAEGEGEAILHGERGTVPREERDGPATPAMRFAVSARENHRCAICGRRRELQGHHFDSRALGGKTLLERLLGACIPCHGLIHAGLIRLNVLPGGKLEIRDHEGSLIGEFDLAEMLPPEKLVLIERELAEVPAAEGEGPSSVATEPEACAPPAVEVEAPAEGAAPVEAEACLDVRSPGVAEAPPLPSELCAPLAAEAAASRIESARSLDELPRSITPEGFRALSGRIEWSAGRRAFLFHPEREALRDTAASTAEAISAEPAPAHRPETSLAEATAREMGAPIHRVFGTLLAESSQVLPLLASLGKGDVLFIDEIHGMSLAATECLHGALEDGHVDIPIVAGPHARVIRLALEPFTVLGATTEPGKLPAPFRARFQEETLAGYALDALAEIATRSAMPLGLSASAEAAGEAARRSRRTPRLARKLIERAGEFAHVRGSGRIEGEDVHAAATSFGIDAFGLKEDDRRILDLLARRSGPIGIDTIAATLNLDRFTVRHVHERWLLEEGLVVRTPRGRAPTAKGREVLALTSGP